MRLSYLPDEITVNGVKLYPVIGSGKSHQKSIDQAKAAKLKYRTVSVFSKGSTGTLSLRGKPYPDRVYLFVEKPELTK